MGVCDISADAEGSIEFTSRFTSIEEPFLLYNPITQDFKEKIGQMAAKDILFHSVDHLPAEMPREASNHFGNQLMPFVEAVCKSDISQQFEQCEDLPEEIKCAVITANGKITPGYQYIIKLREANEKMAEQHDSSSVGMQGFTLRLEGHLFDTGVFNKSINYCEEKGIHFRVVSWEIGTSGQSETLVVLQGLSMDEESLYDAENKIISMCGEHNIKWERV